MRVLADGNELIQKRIFRNTVVKIMRKNTETNRNKYRLTSLRQVNLTNLKNFRNLFVCCY